MTRTLADIHREIERLKAVKKALKPRMSIKPGHKRERSFRPEGPGQRQPRARDNGHLQFIRRLPCVATYVRTGALLYRCDAAHVRFGDLTRGKRHTGMAEKPDDRWTVPLSRPAHEAQHGMNERVYWEGLGVDVLALCEALYAVSGDLEAGEKIIRGLRP